MMRNLAGDSPPPTMPINRQQRHVLRGVVYTLVFISFAVSTFFFVRTLYRNHKADLKARHARLHAGMTEAEVRALLAKAGEVDKVQAEVRKNFGQIGDLNRTLKEIKYDGWLVIEAFGRALPELAAATRVWRDLFPTAKEVYTEGLKMIKEKWA